MKIEELKKIHKNKKEVLCALCATPRVLKHERNLSAKNYLQLIMTTAFTTWALFEKIGYNGLFSFFLFWTLMEFTKKFLYRKEITCPHCGFDATWYKRDVGHARKKVQKFWGEKAPLKANR